MKKRIRKKRLKAWRKSELELRSWVMHMENPMYELAGKDIPPPGFAAMRPMSREELKKLF